MCHFVNYLAWVIPLLPSSSSSALGNNHVVYPLIVTGCNKLNYCRPPGLVPSPRHILVSLLLAQEPPASRHSLGKVPVARCESCCIWLACEPPQFYNQVLGMLLCSMINITNSFHSVTSADFSFFSTWSITRTFQPLKRFNAPRARHPSLSSIHRYLSS